MDNEIMSLDKTLLRIIKYRDKYDIYRNLIREHNLSKYTVQLAHDFKAYFNKYETHDSIDFDVFETWFKQFRHPNMKNDDLAFYTLFFRDLQTDVDPDVEKTMKEDLQTVNYATVITNKAQALLSGTITSKQLVADVSEATDKILEQMEANKDVVWDTSEIDEVAQKTSYESGLKFRLDCLDRSCGSLHPGKFVIVAAYVDSGKSTTLADQFGAGFVDQIINDEDQWYSNRPIIWFNNEGSTSAIKMYFYQSYFGTSADELRKHAKYAKDKYERLTKGKKPFRVVPCQGWHIKDAEQVIKTYKPSVVIYDMLDNFSGFEVNNKNSTGDQRYRKLYDFARQMADKYEHVAVGTSQCNGDAEGLERIPMRMLEGSRVAKQSTADLIVMLGRSLEPGKFDTRYLYTPKNKLDAQPRKNFNRSCSTEVVFNGEMKRLEMPKSPDEVTLQQSEETKRAA